MSEIYAAGEKPIPGISGLSLVESIEHENVSYVENFSEQVDEILSDLEPGDILLTLGAGAVGSLGATLVKRYAQNA